MPAQYLRSNQAYFNKLIETNQSYTTTRHKRDIQRENSTENNTGKNSTQILFRAFSEVSKPMIKAPKKIKPISCEDIFWNPNIKSKLKYKRISLNLIRAKNIASDVFHTKCNSKEDEYQLKAAQCPDFQKSDIFSLNNNTKYEQVFKYKDDYHNRTRESKSDWSTKNTFPTLINYSSTKFDIITNRVLSIPECNKRGIQINPVNMQKSLSEFFDLTRTSNPNQNQSYTQYYSDNIKAFNRQKNICNNYIDIHKNYNALCELPFVKNF